MPCSFGLTPRSQGTPRTPGLSATPLSQDSCYSSLQATPVLQGEPFTYSVHKPLRRELCHQKPSKCHRGSGEVTDVGLFLKQPQPLHTLSNQLQNSSQQLELWGHNAQSSPHNNMEASFNLASPRQDSMVTATPNSLHLNCNTFSILSINFTADRSLAASTPPADHTCTTELSPPAVNCSSSSPQPQVESLDSRIESLLIYSQKTDPSYFDRENLEGDAPSQDSPISPTLANTSPISDDSLVCSPVSCASATTGHQRSYNDPAWLIMNEEDETAQAVSFLTRTSQSPALSDVTHFERRTNVNNKEDAERFQSVSCLKVIPLDLHTHHDYNSRICCDFFFYS